MKNLSPIILFVYNRPWHTEQTVEALKKNELVNDSDLFIFSDGAKTENDENVKKVREYIKTIDGFKSVTIVEREKNIGLANSVITGVTEIINKFGKVIVLEDDVVTAPGFLRFMNEALCFYKSNGEMFSVTGFCFDMEIGENYLYDVWLSYRFSSQAWGTWKRSWDVVDWSLKRYPGEFKNKDKKRLFLKGGANRIKILDLSYKGYVDSWAAPFDFAHYIDNKYCVHPIRSFIQNIGFDSSGTHCGNKNVYKIKDLNAKCNGFLFAQDVVPDDNINLVHSNNYKVYFKSRVKNIFRKIGLIKKVK